MSQLHVPNYHHWRKNVALTHPAVVHEKASFQLRASSDDISICDRRESLRERLSIGSTLLLYANTASRIAETWASRLAGCGCPYIFTWHRLLCCKLFDELSPALTTNTKLIDVDQCGMRGCSDGVAVTGFCCISSAIVVLIFYWTTPALPTNLPFATLYSSQLDKRLHHACKHPHPCRVNMFIANSHK